MPNGSYSEPVIFDDDAESPYLPLYLQPHVHGFHDHGKEIVNVVIDLVEFHLPHDVLDWDVNQAGDWSFDFANATLVLTSSSDEISFFRPKMINRNEGLSRKKMDALRQELRVFFSIKKMFVSFRACAVTILQAVEMVSAARYSAISKVADKGYDARVATDLRTVLSDARGLDAATIPNTAKEYLEWSPEDICRMIPSSFRVLHIESILRPDLARRFLAFKEDLSQCLSREDVAQFKNKIPPHTQLLRSKDLRRQEVVDNILQTQVTFHGTVRRNVASIVQHGFFMPGTTITDGVVASPRSGIAFDRGIYSSPEPYYALSYAKGERIPTDIDVTPGMRLIVCATVMGRTLHKSRSNHETIHGPLREGFDSHYDGGLEYIVHNPAQMLPCYVVHLDLGAVDALRSIQEIQEDPFGYHEKQQEKRVNRPHPRLAQEDKSPGDVKREKEAKKAAAMKWFPYGFGSATGTNFVIDEVGEVSDDEEDYGEYQELRKLAGIASHSQETELDDDEETEETPTGLWMDQYQQARWSKHKSAQ